MPRYPSTKEEEESEEKRKDEAFLLNQSQPLGMVKGGPVIKPQTGRRNYAKGD